MNTRARSICLCGALALVGVVGFADAQSVNRQQLIRVLNGETIPENGLREGDTAGTPEPLFTEHFAVEERDFSAKGSNPYFSLRPGHQQVLEGTDDEGVFIELRITVLSETKTITILDDGKPERIRTRVIEEREFKDGELYEISRNYYARDIRTNDIFYFGEDVCFFEDGECVGTGGSWLAGVNGATPGIMMPGTFFLGARYFQEIAPGIALDRAENATMGLTVPTPAGTFNNCIEIAETTPLEPDAFGTKIYAPGIGMVKEGPLELVSVRRGNRD
ncbi:MAG: hypothetical protein ACKVZJ_05225 [Phycisphaerales bacterium]